MATGHGFGKGPAPKDNKIRLKKFTRQENPKKQAKDDDDDEIWIPTKRFDESQGPLITTRRVKALDSSRMNNTNVCTPNAALLNFDMSARGGHHPSGSFTSYTKDLNYKNVIKKAIHNQSSIKKNPTMDRISIYEGSQVRIQFCGNSTMNTKRDKERGETGGFSPASSKMSEAYDAEIPDTIQAIKVSLVPTQIGDMRQ